jgi:2-iminobutanoate/2-iminopropanoate deaminase
MTRSLKRIDTEGAPKAIGSYSQGLRMDSRQELLFVAGQLPIDPKTGEMVDGGIRLLTHQVIDNLEAILKAGGSGLQQVLRVDIFLIDIKKDFAAMNEEYAKRFQGPNFPVRQTVQVSGLPLGASIEMSCVAYVGE